MSFVRLLGSSAVGSSVLENLVSISLLPKTRPTPGGAPLGPAILHADVLVALPCVHHYGRRSTYLKVRVRIKFCPVYVLTTDLVTVVMQISKFSTLPNKGCNQVQPSATLPMTV